MSLTRIEEVCRERNIPYTKNEEGLVLTLESASVGYPTMVSLRQDGYLQAFSWFPANESLQVENAEDLCSQVNEVLKPSAQIGLEPSENKFWAGCIFAEEETFAALSAFVQACEVTLPLVVRVGQLGRWHPDLIKLAFTAPEDCFGRA